MPSSYSASLRLTLQATGENNNTWGVILNNGVFALVDYSIAGRLGLTVSGARTLSTALGATDEARAAFLDVTGGSGGTVTIPAAPKGYFVRNNAAAAVSISAGGAASAIFGPGDAGPCFSDGSNTYAIRIAGLQLADYIAASILVVSGSLPAALGNLGKTLIVQDVAGTETWVPTFITTANIQDFPAYETDTLGVMVALAVAL